MVYKEKEEESDVDERKKAKYGSWIKSYDVRERYDNMMNLCKRAIAQCEKIVFSDETFKLPKELVEVIGYEDS